ncbi:T9SS type A sorting domain-containing protein [Aquimarina agarivorans]|uniref:T9SS type A sorting domain-containing protein n=1 Tax=Aquimarina agarivorans TaxID=980584 RepID=UPI000248E77D|nr:T9SS type A sorting domain-containing protein [Aquimarina agarivorans]
MKNKITTRILNGSFKSCHSSTVFTNIKMCNILFVITFLTFNLSALSQTHNWTRTNPGGGGWFSCIGASKSGIVLAGSDLSGTYRSKNGGRSWDVIGASRGVKSTHVSGIGFHKTNGNIMFIASGGIHKTTNGGDSWRKTIDTKGYVSDIEFGTNNPNVGYAASHLGNWTSKNAEIFKTTNTGDTWTKLKTNLPNTRILKVIVDINNSNTVYLITGRGRPSCSVADVFKSTNGGTAWTNITDNNNFEGFTEVADFAVDPNNSNTMYLSTVKADCDNRFWRDGLESKLYKSTNGGNTWSKIQDQGGVIRINPNNSNITLLELHVAKDWNSRAGVRLSTNGGNSFTKISDFSRWETVFSGDIAYGGSSDGYCRNMGEDLSNPNNFYTFSAQFIGRTTDGGRNFKVLHGKRVGANGWQSTGVDNLVNMDMVISPKNPNIIYLALPDMGFWRSLDKGKSWENCNSEGNVYGWGQRRGGSFHSIVADPDRENMVWATSKTGHILRNTKTGQFDSWEIVNSDEINLTIYVNGLSLDPNSPISNRTLYLTSEGSVFRSTNDGRNWRKVLDNKFCNYTAVDQFNSNIVYAGGAKGLWKSTDKGANWNKVNSFNDFPADNDELYIRSTNYTGVYDIVTDPNNPNWVYVTTHGKGQDGGLFLSKNQGNSWTKLLTDKYMRQVAVMPKNSDVIYATSSNSIGSGGYNKNSNGIWFTNDGGKNWTKQNKGAAFNTFNSIDISNEDRPYVLAGGQGMGFQKADVPARAKRPSKPTIGGDQKNGVTVYLGCNFKGANATFAPGTYDFKQFKTRFRNDQLSSIKVPKGYKVTLYEHDLKGKTLVLSSDNSCLIAESFNDQTSSIKVEKTQNSKTASRVQINGVYTIKSLANQQNLIAPSWDEHNTRMFNSTNIFPDHQWEIEHIGNGIHQIKNVGTNRFLEIAFGKCERNANSKTWTNANSNHQKWYIEKNGNAHYFKPVHCVSMALDKSSGNDGNVKLWSFSATNDNQKFELVAASGAKILEADKNPFLVYPNPTSGYVNIESSFSANFTITGIDVFSLKGDLVASFTNTSALDLTNLTNGMYLVVVNFKSSESGTVTKQVVKLIKE